jgi:Fe-S oxidoreductase
MGVNSRVVQARAEQRPYFIAAATPAVGGSLIPVPPAADDVRGLCCSTPWSSKGYKRGQTWMSEQMSDALWRWSNEGKLPVVVDAASCTLGLKDDLLEHLDDERKDCLKRITIIDSTCPH